jgi:acetylornithine deacetylase/succinyl-diaminopimelate desuccinylase-like protein
MADKPDRVIEYGAQSPAPELLAAIARVSAEPLIASCLQFFLNEKKWLNERHVELCRVPAPTFREHHRAKHLAALMRQFGHPTRIDAAGNVVVPVIFDKSLPFVAVSAHTDTALVPRKASDISVRPDGTLEGPGVTDNGTGLVTLLALGRALSEAPRPSAPRRNLLLVANVAEEGEGNLHGMKFLCRHSPFASRIDTYLVIDGASTSHITAEGLGSRRFEIAIEGHGGHSWNDYGRANPIHAMGRIIAFLADLELPASPRTTLSVGVIEGGSGVNSIAPIVRAKVDIRSRSSDAMQRVVTTLEETVRLGVEAENRRSTDRLSSYKLREIGHRPAAPRIADNPLVHCLQAVDSFLGIASRLDCASTDANVPLSMGLPAVAIGAGGRGGDAHTPTEWFHPEGREQGLRRVMLALGLLMFPPAPKPS